MSTFICTVCGARFEGDLREASDAAFAHTAEHAERPRVQQTLFAGRLQDSARERGGQPFRGYGNRLFSEPEAAA